ncbi:MAG: Stp1/IreP family PP2C-type Ser/Thr phosphatase [Myxococcota bacterium]|jgi:serine/threonine protein phosphatase PrpC|nr:Stp1/IreP family PP2C-type Ser/Thr phosphatase [Myxococcota bacterium]
MSFTCAARTNVGLVRTNNEDSYLVDEELGLYIVCDGMGGHKAGEVASQTACETLKREVHELAPLIERFERTGLNSDAKEIKKAVETAVQNACREIYSKASKDSDCTGMGTTCSMVLMIGHNKGVLGHVGDSRLYMVRQEKLYQLSEDHTYVNELVKRGALTQEQAENHPQANVLTRALGVQASVSADTMVFDVDPGDVFLLCSDGLFSYFQQPQDLIGQLSQDDLEAAVDVLIQQALNGGAHDNCTGVIMRAAPQETDQITAADRIDTLRRIPLFNHLNYKELVKVVGSAQLSKMVPGDFIIREGTLGEEFYVVLTGDVEVTKGENHLVTLKAGGHFGEMSMIDAAPRSATCQAKSDVNVLVIKRGEFFNIIRTEPVIASKLLWSFVQALSGRLRETNEALMGAKQLFGPETNTEFEVFEN